MASSPDKPDFNKMGIESSLQGGNDLFQTAMDLVKGGLPYGFEESMLSSGRRELENALGGERQRLNEAGARNRGAVPLGYMANTAGNLYGKKGDALTEMRDNLAKLKLQGRQMGFDSYAKMYQLALGKGGLENDLYKTELENTLSWDKLLATLIPSMIGAGATIGGAKIMEG